MIGCVAGRRDRAQRQTGSKLEHVVGADITMCDLEVGALRSDESGAAVRKCGAARDVVGVRMRVGGERNREPARLRGREMCFRYAGWINDERASIAEVDDIRQVSEALVDERDNINHWVWRTS